jgi:hypothetical protein
VKQHQLGWSCRKRTQVTRQLAAIIAAVALTGAGLAQAAPGCDNGVSIGGTACKSQGDSVEYVCLPGSEPGKSLWQARGCNGGTCQGAACKAASPSGGGSSGGGGSGCDNGVPVGGTACKTQGDPVEYLCLPGSKPGQSLWQARNCNGGTCQGAACKGSGSGGSGCDNGVPVGGTACKTHGDPVEYLCLPGSKPGKSLWQARNCNGGTCQGTACKGSGSGGSGCDNGVPVGGTACKTHGDPVEYLCLPGSKPGKSLWQARSCNGGTCQGTSCASSCLTNQAAQILRIEAAGKRPMPGGPWTITRDRDGTPGSVKPLAQGNSPKCFEGCDNGVPVGETACKQQGDTVEYICKPGSTPGKSLWESRACTNGKRCRNRSCEGTRPCSETRDCAGKDPQLEGCTADAQVLAEGISEANFQTMVEGTPVSYRVVMRIKYSPRCGAAWIQIEPHNTSAAFPLGGFISNGSFGTQYPNCTESVACTITCNQLYTNMVSATSGTVVTGETTINGRDGHGNKGYEFKLSVTVNK